MTLPVNEIVCGSALDVLKQWPSESVDCCVTSPPYWGLRNYGVEGQLGLEKTPEEYVAKLVEIFREVKRVMKDDATLFLNMGDSYWGGGNTRGNNSPISNKQASNTGATGQCAYHQKNIGTHDIIKPKDLCGIPWRLAFALQADGWWLRQDIIWHKPNPMPESVTDRCTKAHEYIFLMTKEQEYYYDATAIREDDSGCNRNRKFSSKEGCEARAMGKSTEHREWQDTGKRNKRSVWTVPTSPFSQAHFATFPPKLIEPCILAGCPEWVCTKCGKARERVIEKPIPPKDAFTETRREGNDEHIGGMTKDGKLIGMGGKLQKWLNEHPPKTTGWTKCNCNADFTGGIVLDPFMGSGTTAMVAYENRRNYVGIELNENYIKFDRAAKAKEKYALFENNQ